MFELFRELYGVDCPSLVSQHSFGSVTVNPEMLITVDHPYENVDMTVVRSTALTEIIEPVAVEDSIDSSSINLVLFKTNGSLIPFFPCHSCVGHPTQNGGIRR